MLLLAMWSESLCIRVCSEVFVLRPEKISRSLPSTVAPMASTASPPKPMARATFPLELSFKDIATADDIVKRVAEMQVAAGELALPAEDEIAAYRETSSASQAATVSSYMSTLSSSSAASAGASGMGGGAGTTPMVAFGLPEPNRKVYSAVRLDNNQLESLEGLGAALARVCKDPTSIRMLDLSFNQLGPKTAAALSRLGMDGMVKLYLHGNAVKHLSEVDELAKAFPALQGLTLHGTPLREHDSYRNYVIATVPRLVKLDFTPVTPAERDVAVSWRSMTKVRSKRM